MRRLARERCVWKRGKAHAAAEAQTHRVVSLGVASAAALLLDAAAVHAATASAASAAAAASAPATPAARHAARLRARGAQERRRAAPRSLLAHETAHA
jgi:hypothetical protein